MQLLYTQAYLSDSMFAYLKRDQELNGCMA